MHRLWQVQKQRHPAMITQEMTKAEPAKLKAQAEVDEPRAEVSWMDPSCVRYSGSDRSG